MRGRIGWVLVAAATATFSAVFLAPSLRGQVGRITRSALLLPRNLLSVSPAPPPSTAAPPRARSASSGAAGGGVVSGVSYRHDTSPPLRDIPPVPYGAGRDREEKNG
ncbi:MAG TPA: hypothetical protein VKG01_19220, partial [Thermoanaerobaculia bacterium]|nr:hypothetical protein [Thermoanaerobaculia bacterium]